MFAVPDRAREVLVEFKDALTAFNAEKKGSFADKGALNAQITALLYDDLKTHGIATHLKQLIPPREMICEKVEIIPLEVVVRNRLAGSTAKKLGFKEGTALEAPLVEFYYKDDALGDPFLSDDQALLMKAVPGVGYLDTLRTLARAINAVLAARFLRANLELIDFKLEFGRDADGALILADEISPDTCRLWDVTTGEKFDKDRFRRDLGQVEEAYREVLNRLQGSV